MDLSTEGMPPAPRRAEASKPDGRDLVKMVGAVLTATTDGPATAALYLMEAAADLLGLCGGREVAANFFEMFVEERLRNNETEALVREGASEGVPATAPGSAATENAS
jgi:hypothetical protein